MTFALVTCSGISNTGKLTTQAARILLQRKPGKYIWMHTKQSAATLEAEIGDAEQVIVIDGCMDCCATKKLAKVCLASHRHIIATELGIEKNGMAEVQYDEIEKVVRAVIDEGGET
ncbi:MAG: putative zinc-binding protein [Methanoregula sp.]|nr:putative zinc-binding protein [Methanoregula sp.]